MTTGDRAVALAERVHFRFSASSDEVLRGASLMVRRGEVVALCGRSGSGKSTLLSCLGGILRPSKGRVEVAGQPVSALDDAGRSAVRRSAIGFVFQFGELVPELTVLSNVALPLELLGVDRREAERRAMVLVEALGLAELTRRLPGQLSGGQAQRAAVARALVHEPPLLLADEPTGALDRANAELVLGALLDLVRARETALVLVTHDREVAARADRMVEMADGVVRTSATAPAVAHAAAPDRR